MKSVEEMKEEWYEMLFSYPQIKDITDKEKKELICYFNDIDYLVNGSLKEHIFERLKKIIWDLIWGLDDMTIYGIVDVVQESSVAIWILNNKQLPTAEWLINNYLDYWIEDPKRLCEPLNMTGTDGNFHESIGNASNRCINKYANWAIEIMKHESICKSQ